MEKAAGIFYGIIFGLLLTCAFIGISILGSYIAGHFGWNKSFTYIAIIGIVYQILLDNDNNHNKIDTIIGLATSFIILFFFCLGKETIPLWCYVTINSIIGINIIITCIKVTIKNK